MLLCTNGCFCNCYHVYVVVDCNWYRVYMVVIFNCCHISMVLIVTAILQLIFVKFDEPLI